MKPKGHIFFKVLLNKFNPGSAESLLKYLPKEEAQNISRQPQLSNDPSEVFTWPEMLIARTHYSWLAPILAQMPKKLQPTILAALPPQAILGLQKITNIQPQKNSLSSPAKAFLIQQLFRQWKPSEAVPLDFLPKTPLRPLLDMPKKDMVQVIDFLGLYDLVDAIRHIVDKKQLKAIYTALNPQKQQFIRSLLLKREKITAPKLDLGKWDFSPSTLNDMIHKRGLIRFTKALSGQDPDFLWHIIHILDTGRGTLISQNVSEKEISGLTPLLIQQVLNVINFIKEKSDE